MMIGRISFAALQLSPSDLDIRGRGQSDDQRQIAWIVQRVDTHIIFLEQALETAREMSSMRGSIGIVGNVVQRRFLPVAGD
jgi:hypothetical protein